MGGALFGARASQKKLREKVRGSIPPAARLSGTSYMILMMMRMIRMIKMVKIMKIKIMKIMIYKYNFADDTGYG